MITILIIWESTNTYTLAHESGWIGGGLILFQSILFICRQCAWAPPWDAAAEGLMFATHVNIWQSITFPPTIFSCSGLWNEGANKLAFYVYLCVGVSEQREREISFSKALALNLREEGRERERKGWMFWSHDSSPDCPSCLSCAKHDPPLPQPRQ